MATYIRRAVTIPAVVCMSVVACVMVTLMLVIDVLGDRAFGQRMFDSVTKPLDVLVRKIEHWTGSA